MTTKQQLDFCSVCKRRKMDMGKGLVCSLTNEKPAFDPTCPDYLEDEAEARRKKVEEVNENEAKKDITGWTAFFLFAGIGLGLVISVVSSVVSVVQLGLMNLASIYTIIYLCLFLYVGVSCILAFLRHKPNAVALAYTYCAMIAVDAITTMVAVEPAAGVKGMAWAIIWSLYITFSEDIKWRFSKEEREWHKPEKIVFGIQAALSLILILLCTI